jgi:adenosylcobinamide kinase/adenosylcobinamide-phosphate guanylyltransferase
MALVVFTGGARSGKSVAAQELVRTRAADGGRVAVVVFGRGGDDPEYAARIAAHRRARPDGWDTIEVTDTSATPAGVPDESIVLLDCLGTMLGRAMEETYAALARDELGRADESTLPEGFEAAVAARFNTVVEWLAGRSGDTVVVTNEVGAGIVPSYATGRLFRDMLGRANRLLVDRADASYLCVCGRLIALDSAPREAAWPAD